MAFEPLSNIPVRVVDTTIDVVSKGSGSQAQDDVFVTAQLQLQGEVAAGERATLILPLASEAQQQPILRYTDKPITGAQVFAFDDVDRSDYDQEVVKSLEALGDGASKREQRDLAVDIGRAAKSFSSTVVTVEPGQRTLRLFYGISADKVGDREFEFSVIGPLPSFVIQAGGSIGVIAALPRNTTVVKAEGLFNPNDPNSVVPPSNATLGGRPVWGWFWQNDPLFRIRYRY
ncbi:hypothetical protein E4P40_02380 [Blastococcus sp. CT_GayMR20]|uniref:hypothetical protein n=1 Tax=Blastococcus sp. CT_GayMR20 TaxID=2559609 RepID=UPI00107320E5|nr:hypothetical protein [Blastococcus sp. CT_GayMR20]TFV92606.1 hypothetical protein E4P40_02365 [Blastococcus sp. CT_GayMR20]TFV92607.1 hypothetical protein E4P40_02380 [Blastococcus sp. CT_GayMR20]